VTFVAGGSGVVTKPRQSIALCLWGGVSTLAEQLPNRSSRSLAFPLPQHRSSAGVWSRGAVSTDHHGVEGRTSPRRVGSGSPVGSSRHVVPPLVACGSRVVTTPRQSIALCLWGGVSTLAEQLPDRSSRSLAFPLPQHRSSAGVWSGGAVSTDHHGAEGRTSPRRVGSGSPVRVTAWRSPSRSINA